MMSNVMWMLSNLVLLGIVIYGYVRDVKNTKRIDQLNRKIKKLRGNGCAPKRGK